jgi:hypothetical protein
MINLDYKLNSILIDRLVEPTWAPKIKRWSQLDDASFVLAQATSECFEFLKWDFDQLIVVSTQGSGKTDRLFVTDTKISPSHFVHTLPNVRTLVFSLLTGWEGEMYCLSQGKHSLVNFLKEVPLVHAQARSLVININKVGDYHECDFYKIAPDLNTFVSVSADHINDFAFRSELASRNFN